MALDRQGTAAFSVQAKVFGKGLSEQQGNVRLRQEKPQGRGILFGIAAGKSLVGRIEKDQVSLGANDVGNFLPLFHRGIATGGIVRARVQENNGSIGRPLQILNHAVQIQIVRRAAVVSVRVRGEAAFLKDLEVISPRGIGNVYILAGRIVTGQEFAPDATGARAGQGLDAGHLDVRIVEQFGTVGKLEGLLDKGVVSFNRQVFFIVRRRCEHEFFGLSHDGQDPRFALFVAVRSHANVDLVGVGRFSKGLGNPQNGVGRTGRHMTPYGRRRRGCRGSGGGTGIGQGQYDVLAKQDQERCKTGGGHDGLVEGDHYGKEKMRLFGGVRLDPSSC
mmetsp:Transcript_5590/g.12303  ORF Transcript_5590/g.12303 Transcript_5590/m.12303 type:complete len:333 (+) Transcript_5590:531-1529(+)